MPKAPPAVSFAEQRAEIIAAEENPLQNPGEDDPEAPEDDIFNPGANILNDDDSGSDGASPTQSTSYN